jgi:hypothetical protein
MMFEDNMEVPIGSVKDALVEAVAERECPEDTALIATIFSHVAEVPHPSPLAIICARVQDVVQTLACDVTHSHTNLVSIVFTVCRSLIRTTRRVSSPERSERS